MSIKRRFIYNTHENAERPYYVSVLLKTCTKPRESISITNLAHLAHKKLRGEMGFPIPERATPYVIQTAIELGALERDVYREGLVNRWGARGYVINAISPDIPLELPLDLRLLEKDRLAFLKYYLDTDGFALLYLAEKLRSEGEIILTDFVKGSQVELMWNGIIKESMSYVRDDRLRSEMRKLLKSSRFLRGTPKAKGKTLEHVRKQKVTPHMELLVDFDIVERSPPPMDWRDVAKDLGMKDRGVKRTTTATQEKVIYRPRLNASTNRVSTFLEKFANGKALDNILSPQEGRYFAAAAELYGLDYPKADLESDFSLIEKEVVKAYESTRDNVYRLAFTDSIKDIVCINVQVNNKRVCEPQDVWAAIEKMHRSSEKDVRYHRDNYGVITYVALTDNYVKNVLTA